MAAPIEMHKGNERQTVYSEIKVAALTKKGWGRVSDLTNHQRDLLEQGKLPAEPAKPKAASIAADKKSE